MLLPPVEWDDVVEMLPYGVLVLPTILLAFWPRARQLAVVPLALCLLVVGAFFSYGMGVFLHERALNPRMLWCGNVFELPMLGLIGLGGWTVATGAGLMLPASSRPVGRVLLTRVFPMYLATCAICGALGRYLVK